MFLSIKQRAPGQLKLGRLLPRHSLLTKKNDAKLLISIASAEQLSLMLQLPTSWLISAYHLLGAYDAFPLYYSFLKIIEFVKYK